MQTMLSPSENFPSQNPLKTQLICDECSKHHACFHCEECGQDLCQKCDKKLHSKGKRAAHPREALAITVSNSQITSSDDRTDKNSSVRSSLEQLSLTSKKIALLDNKDSIKTGSKLKSLVGSDETSTQTKNNHNVNILEKLNESPSDVQNEKDISQIDNKFEKSFVSLNITTNENQSMAVSFTADNNFINQSFTEGFAKEIQIDDYQSFKNIEIMGSFDLSKLMQNILRSYAEKGETIIKKEVLENELSKHYKTVDFNNLFKEAEEKKIIQIISRKFGDSKPHIFMSLFLDSLSIQSLSWIIKSLINDELTPNEKMILNRIKEAFALKLNPVVWQGIWKYLQKKSKDQNNKILVPKLPCLKLIENFNSQNVLMKIITLEDKPAFLIDQENLSPEDQGIWDEFLKFLDNFFDEKSNNTFTKKTEKAKWSCSVETFLSKTKNKPLIIPPKSSSKAIPGGKYGCAQFIKCCGPEILSKLSLGKLSVLAQEAINRKLLDHYKTLLIKSTRFHLGVNLAEKTMEEVTNESKNPKILMKIKSIKKIIVDLLHEHPNGISLARLPEEIKKKVNFYYDLHEIGFNKLKDFLMELPNVEIIEMKASKLSIARLKKSEILNNDNMKGLFINDNNYRDLNEAIIRIIESHPQGITGPELFAMVENHFSQDFRFQHLLTTNTFFSYLLQNFRETIDISFKDKFTMIFRMKNQNNTYKNIIPKNLEQSSFSFFKNDSMRSEPFDMEAHYDSNYNSFSKSSMMHFNSSGFMSNFNNNQQNSFFNTNVSSIKQVPSSPFQSNNLEENNRTIDEMLKAIQRGSMEKNYGSYSYFGDNRTSNLAKKINSEKKKMWDLDPQHNLPQRNEDIIKDVKGDPELLDYLSNAHKMSEGGQKFKTN